MTSADGNSTKRDLLFLIYQHLMANGYPKAAGVLRRHVAQKESTAAGTSLDEIYSRWLKDAKETSASPVKKPGRSKSPGEDEETPPPSASQTSLNLSTVNSRGTQPVLKSPMAKKPGASDTESTDDSDIIENTPQPPKILSTPKVSSVSASGKASKMVRSEKPKKKTGHDGDSDSECDIQPSQVPFFTPTRTATQKPVTTDKDAVSTDSSDIEETGLSKQVQAKRSPGKSILAKRNTIKSNQALHSKTADTNQVTAPEKMGSSTDSDSTGDSDSSKKAPAQGIPVKTSLSVSAKTAPAPKTPATAESSDTESSDSGSEEEVVAKTVSSKAAPVIPARSNLMTPTKATPTRKTPAVGRKDVMSDSGSSEDSDSEEEAPVKAVLAKGVLSKPNLAKLSQGTPTKAATATKSLCATKKDASSDSGSSEDSDSEEEAPVSTVVTKGAPSKPSQPKPIITTATPKAASTGKKAESSDSESSDDLGSDEDAFDSTVIAKALPAKASRAVLGKPLATQKGTVTGKKAESSDTESSDSGSEEEVVAKTVSSKAAPVIPARSNLMTPTKATPTRKTPAVGRKDVMSDSGSSEDSDSEEEAPVKAVLAKGVLSKPNLGKPSQGTSTKAATTTKSSFPTKKDASSDSGSSDSEEEAPVKTVPAKGAKSKPSQSILINTTATPKAASTGKKAESSDSESSEDSDSEEEAPVKTVPAKGATSKPSQSILINTTATPKAASTGKKAESSDSESSEDSDSDEEALDSTVLAKGPPAKPSQPPLSKQGKGNLPNLTKPFQAAPTPAKSAAAKTLDTTKKAASSDSKSNTILPKGVPNKTNQPTTNQITAALKVPAVGTAQDSSYSESSDETDSEEKTPTKKVGTAQPKAVHVKAKAAAKVAKPAKGQGMSNGCTPAQKMSAAAEHMDADGARGESSEDSSSSEDEEASQSLLAPKPPPKKSPSVSKKTPAEKGKREKGFAPSGSKTTTNVTPASPWTVTKMTPVVFPANELDSDVTDIERDPTPSASKAVAATSKGKKGVKIGDLAANSPLAKASSTKKAPPAVGSSSEAPTPLAKPKRGKDKSERDAPKPKKRKTGSPEPSKAVAPPPIPAAGGDSESDSDSSLDVEKWKRLALHLTDSDIAKMDAIASVDLGSPAISVPGKATKKGSKTKEKNGKAKAGGKQSHGTASGTKKAAPPTSDQLAPSVTDNQSAEAKAKPAKRPLFTATSAQYGHKTPEKKQKLDKDDTKQTSSEKRKDVKEKKNKHQKAVARRKEGTADVNLPPAAAKLSLLPEEKAAKKNKLKLGKEKNLSSTPSKTLQNDSRDTGIQSPLSDSNQKKKKKSSKNK